MFLIKIFIVVEEMFRVQIQLILLFCLATIAMAGEVKLKDGSLLKGKILKVHNEVLTIETNFIGKLSIKMEDISEVASDEVVKIKNEDGAIHEKKYQSNDDGLLLTLWSDGQDPDIFQNIWKRSVWLDFNQRNGNSTEVQYKGGFNIRYLRERDTTKFSGRFDSRDRNERKTSDDRQIGLDYERLMGPNRKHSWYVRTHWLKDKIDEIKLRSTYASGYGYYFLRSLKTQLRGRAGIQYRIQDYYEDSTERSTGVEFGMDFKTKILDNLSWYTEMEYSPAFDDFSNYIVLHESGFSVPLGIDIELNLRAGIEHEYTSQPAEDVESIDTRYFLRLEFEF